MACASRYAVRGSDLKIIFILPEGVISVHPSIQKRQPRIRVIDRIPHSMFSFSASRPLRWRSLRRGVIIGHGHTQTDTGGKSSAFGW